MAGNAVQANVGHRHRPRRPARSRRRRVRDKVVQNLISYLVWSTYLGVGVAVADSNHYLDHGSGVAPIISGIVAVLFWPIVFLGADLHV